MSCTHRGQGSSMKPLLFLLFGLKSPWLYNIPDANANFCRHIYCNLPLTRCMWTRLLLTSHPRKCRWLQLHFTAYTYFLRACHSCNFRGIYSDKTGVLFTLGTKYISCYFSSQYPTFTATLTDVKGFQVNI